MTRSFNRCGQCCDRRNAGERGTIWHAIWRLAILVTLALVTGAFDAVASVPVVQPEPANATVAAGDVAMVSIVIQNAQDLYGLDVRVHFDPAVVEVVDADSTQAGIQLAAGLLPQPDFVARNMADNTSGVVQYAVTQINPTEPANGDGVIVTIAFRGRVAGRQSALTIESVTLANRDGTTLPVALHNGVITVKGSGGQTPAPTVVVAPTATPTRAPVLATATPGVTPPPAATATQVLPPPTLQPTSTLPPAATATATATTALAPAVTATIAVLPASSPSAARTTTRSLATAAAATPALASTAIAPAATATGTSISAATSLPAAAPAGGTVVSQPTLSQPVASSQHAAATERPAQPTTRRAAPAPLGPAPAAPRAPALFGLEPTTLLGAALVCAGLLMLAGLVYVSRRR